MTNYLVIYVTCPTLEEAEKIGEFMVSSRYAACVNIIPKIKSIYWWEGELQREEEVLLVFKTVAELLPVFEENIKKHHTYSVPEITAVNIDLGSEEYLSWLKKETLNLRG